MAARLQAIHMLALIARIVKKNFDLGQVTDVGYRVCRARTGPYIQAWVIDLLHDAHAQVGLRLAWEPLATPRLAPWSNCVRPSEALPEYRETIRRLVAEAGMANPRVFGSVLRGEDEEDSDLDILVDPAPRASLLAMEILQSRLASATGVKIDLRTPEEIHPKFRNTVLAEAASL